MVTVSVMGSKHREHCPVRLPSTVPETKTPSWTASSRRSTDIAEFCSIPSSGTVSSAGAGQDNFTCLEVPGLSISSRTDRTHGCVSSEGVTPDRIVVSDMSSTSWFAHMKSLILTSYDRVHDNFSVTEIQSRPANYFSVSCAKHKIHGDYPAFLAQLRESLSNEALASP